MKAITSAAVAYAALVLAATAAAVDMRSWFGDGIYRVRKDVWPGTYRTLGGGGCYWARLRSFSGSVSSILANDNAVGPAVVTIKRTDKGFETRGCGNWTRNLHRVTKSMTRFGQGTFIVRTDIAPGTYRSSGGSACYWERLRDFTGGLYSIIAKTTPADPQS
jgi:hypothetical protein